MNYTITNKALSTDTTEVELEEDGKQAKYIIQKPLKCILFLHV